MLKAVLMDIDDTLLDFGKCAEQAMRIGFAEWGLPYDDSTSRRSRASMTASGS